jgi:hypothetical protein
VTKLVQCSLFNVQLSFFETRSFRVFAALIDAVTILASSTFFLKKPCHDWPEEYGGHLELCVGRGSAAAAEVMRL